MSAELDRLIRMMDQVVSMELRVENSEVQSALDMMDGYGLRYKNSWASMEMSGHTVIEFWRKDLFKSSAVPQQNGASGDDRDRA
ncbi:hypothetical protein SAMN05216312_110269 [Cohnella sp. OV330]|uniref:hypothetical protein n=1 Tax=Cohnella sp. OV330 TaxID=1855288 RepID=UPI0008E4BCAE|nr:hypothetical protein [Cohnella sp. OV330]SFB50682.1 hypothetical protein SAMN05216312_110269 [Cohnella sp. OV330]